MRRLALLLPLLAAPVAAQQALPVDSAVRIGQLPNGMRYWVRQHPTPQKRLELRLVVHAGSVLEDDDQRGLAHFVEHMAFNGTTRFQRNDLVHYLESIGVRFGADLNASTGFDETIYYLPVPTDSAGVVERAFDILQDWASGVRFDSTDVVGERGVILGEWRSGLGAGSRIRDREFPVLFQGSRYATRLPIGDTAIIAHANPATLQRFYRDWYRPDLMAIVAVGDVPADRLVALITDRFGRMPRPASPRPRMMAEVPEIDGTRVSIVTDPELTTESVQLLVRRPTTHYRTVDDERRALVHALISTIVSQRLADIQRRPEAQFVSAYFGPSRLVADIDVFALGVTAKNGQTAAAFRAVLLELRRLAVHGVLLAELDRAKASLLRSREQAAAEEAKTFSAVFAEEYVDAFLHGSATPSDHAKLALAREILPQIGPSEVNEAARESATGNDRFVALRAPDGAAAQPTRAELLAILAATDTANVSRWTEQVVTGPLVPAPPAPGRIVSTTPLPALGAFEWRLDNGVRVFVKPTDFKADEIVVAATSPGGKSLIADADVVHADMATTLMREGGYGAFDAASLRRRLAGTIASVSPILGETSEGFRGTTSPRDIGTFFEVLWLAATAPRYDSTAMAAFLDRMRAQLVNRDRTPFAAFTDTLMLTLANGDPRVAPLTTERLAQVDPRRALALMADRFADFGDFTFAIVGAVDTAALRPLVERWLGALPTTGRREEGRDVSGPDLTAPVTKVVRRGKEPVSMQLVVGGGRIASYTPAASRAATAAGDILQTRLLDALREAMGATYSVNVMTGLMPIPTPNRMAVINFTSAPELADSLWRAADRVLDDLLRTGPTEAEVATYKEKAMRELDVDERTNDHWLGIFMSATESGFPAEEWVRTRERIAALTPGSVHDAARVVFDRSNLARFVLLPEAQPAVP